MPSINEWFELGRKIGRISCEIMIERMPSFTVGPHEIEDQYYDILSMAKELSISTSIFKEKPIDDWETEIKRIIPNNKMKSAFITGVLVAQYTFLEALEEDRFLSFDRKMIIQNIIGHLKKCEINIDKGFLEDCPSVYIKAVTNYMNKMPDENDTVLLNKEKTICLYVMLQGIKNSM